MEIEMSDKEQLHDLINQLPEAEMPAALRYLQSLLAHEAPLEPEMLARIDRARAIRAPGIPHEAVIREFGK
jgi:hypothetical protein